ncbi:restriction endonuclease subunit S, partial [Ignavibacterium album]|uniref:restriction endonuclease subunit S n=1 Tax=Ignavibacterium album TaxID=591197 RepID=UPI0038B3CD82
ASLLSQLVIPLPPIPEQKKIAYVLSKIQQAIETQEKIIKTTQELKKALMQKLFTEGLNGEPQKQTEIGLIPESWEVVPFNSIAEFKNGINFKKEQKGDKGILTIDVLNMYGRSYFVEFDNLYRVNKKINESYFLKADDLLFVRSSLKLEGVGWSSLFNGNTEPTTYCGFIIRARISDPTINKKYLTYFFRTNFARSKLISKSAKLGITNINQGNLGNVLVPIPAQKEQEEIVRVLLNLDTKLEFLTRNKEAQQELFKNMLNQLMTGQIRVKDIEFELEETAEAVD